jgi:hypothetical protein
MLSGKLRKGGEMFRLACLFAGLAFAAGAAAQESRSDLFSQQPGRYQIVINPQMRADTFLLDTATGKVWQLIKFSDIENQPTAWRYMDRLDNSMEVMLWADKREKLKEPSEPVSLPPIVMSKPRAPLKLNAN